MLQPSSPPTIQFRPVSTAEYIDRSRRSRDAADRPTDGMQPDGRTTSKIRHVEYLQRESDQYRLDGTISASTKSVGRRLPRRTRVLTGNWPHLRRRCDERGSIAVRAGLNRD